MSKRARTRSHRRDRRKAKASGWRRQGKPQMGHVGHGASGTTSPAPSGTQMAPVGPVPHEPRAAVAPKHALRVMLGDLVDAEDGGRG